MNVEERAILAELLRRENARRRTTYCPHDPTPKQRAFVDYDGLEALYGGAAGGGKSDALLMGALKYVRVSGYAALIVRRTFRDLAQPKAIMDRARTWLAGTDAKWNDRDKRFTFPSGATITFGYLEKKDDHLQYQGAELQYIAFDELTQFEERQYTYLFSRLRRVHGVDVPLRMRAATNPGGPGHVWVKGRWGIPDDVDMSRPHSSDGRVFFPARLDDNPHVDAVEYERALAQLDAITREQLRKGTWKHDTSTLVYAFDPHVHLVDALPPLPRRARWIYVLGADFGYGDAFALAVWAFCLKLGDVSYLVESQKWSKLIPSATAKVIQAWSKRYPFSRMVGDVGGLGKGYAEEGRQRFALPIEPAEKQNKRGFIRLINGAYEDRKIFVVRHMNTAFVQEIAGLPWKDSLREEEAPGVPNDLCDAHLYGWRESRSYRGKLEEDAPPPGSAEAAELEDQQAAAAEDREAQEEEWEKDLL